MKAKFLVQITHCSKELDNILGSFQNDAIWHNVPFQIILVNLVNVGIPCLKLVISIPYRKHFIGNSCQIRINKQELFNSTFLVNQCKSHSSYFSMVTSNSSPKLFLWMHRKLYQLHNSPTRS